MADKKQQTIEYTDHKTFKKYVGEVNGKGEPHGKGHAIFVNGSTYEGEFENGLRHGEGMWIDNHETTKFIGEWFYGDSHGKRTDYEREISVSDGVRKVITDWEMDFDGEVVFGRKCGKGVRYYSKHERVEGTFVGYYDPDPTEDYLHFCDGEMRIWTENVSRREKTIVDVLEEQKKKLVVETVVYPSGDKFVGRLDGGGHPAGIGTIHFANGDKYEGAIFYMFTRELAGKGIFYYANGDRYEGAWLSKGYKKEKAKDDYSYAHYADDVVGIIPLKHGKGVYTYAGGKVEHQIFSNGERIK